VKLNKKIQLIKLFKFKHHKNLLIFQDKKKTYQNHLQNIMKFQIIYKKVNNRVWKITKNILKTDYTSMLTKKVFSLEKGVNNLKKVKSVWKRQE